MRFCCFRFLAYHFFPFHLRWWESILRSKWIIRFNLISSPEGVKLDFFLDFPSPCQAEDWEIEEGAVEYIRYLRDAIQKLEMENKEASRRTPASFQPRDISKQEQTAPVAAPPVLKTWASPNVIVNMAGRDAHINICTLKRSGLLPAIADALEKRNLKMVALHVSSDNRTTIMMIHAQVSFGETCTPLISPRSIRLPVHYM